MVDLTTPEGQNTQTQRSHAHPDPPLDALDVALLSLIRDNPRVGVLELSRLASVARPTVQSRLQRLEAEGIVTGYGPDVDLTAAGYPVHAFVSLEIAQGALEHVAAELSAIPDLVDRQTDRSELGCRRVRIEVFAFDDESTHDVSLSALQDPHRVSPLVDVSGRLHGSTDSEFCDGKIARKSQPDRRKHFVV